MNPEVVVGHGDPVLLRTVIHEVPVVEFAFGSVVLFSSVDLFEHSEEIAPAL